ncbi:hypothetical protein C7H19_24055 [Aphanothece hegewaldii CCALA 016]|uniref:DUF2997 domain-containing protein n=1 Tax=Aphanothece hegewaldii CCALA 016 TaxID=2107694 RepID=A0A2T1LQX8_9CHRO|nr:DUF2997 domain-containing protein [Aphanothece hegewaldii]PSF30082.1 hypothetical protein C7H19_24055 [Aphanothece hegewaldii CCALA 016]
MTEILITFNDDGTQELEVIQGDGKSCTNLTQALEEVLGKIEDRTFKTEYHQTQIQQKQKLKNYQ